MTKMRQHDHHMKTNIIQRPLPSSTTNNWRKKNRIIIQCINSE